MVLRLRGKRTPFDEREAGDGAYQSTRDQLEHQAVVPGSSIAITDWGGMGEGNGDRRDAPSAQDTGNLGV